MNLLSQIPKFLTSGCTFILQNIENLVWFAVILVAVLIALSFVRKLTQQK